MKYNTQKRRLYYDKVIQLYRDEGLGRRKIAKIIPIWSNTISVWIRNFVDENPQYESNIMKKNKSRKAEVTAVSKDSDVITMQREIARLSKALSQQTMRADAFDEMINVAERQFNIQIRKKAGAKQ
jgi:transposase